MKVLLRKLSTGTLLIALLASLACTPAATPAQPAATAAPGKAAPAQKKLVIGFTASQTGAQNYPPRSRSKACNSGLDDVTKAGGIKLKDGTALMPEMKYYDDESKTDRVQALYTKLILEDKVDFLISPYSSGLAKAAAVVSEQNGKVMITTGAADDATMEQGFKSVYQMYTPASRYLLGAVDVLAKLDPSAKKIAIIYEKDSFSTSVAKAVEPYAKEQGLRRRSCTRATTVAPPTSRRSSTRSWRPPPTP